MFSFFYNCALFLLGLIAFPKILWQWLVLGKYRKSLGARLGFHLPDISKTAPTIWIHTVSMGETRAVAALFKKIRAELPHATILISSVTETGHQEAKRSLPEAQAHFFLPLDFSWIIRKVVRKYRPDLLILVESDFWYHLLQETKKLKGRVILVNGKISERSAKRFAYFPSFAKMLFGSIDLFCLQSERFQERFSQIGIDPRKLLVTGNLKLDTSSPKLTAAQIASWKETLGIAPHHRVLVIGSTHEPEEELLLSALEPVWQKIPHLKVILVPRHPERFSQVAKQLHHLPFIAFSQKEERTGAERIILIDAMGLLHTCYQLADVAIVGGSFTEKVGGHNFFEPVECGVPVLFGPHTHAQPDLAQIVLEGKAGKQLTLSQLPDSLIELLANPQKGLEMSQAALKLSRNAQGASQRTWDTIFPFI